MKTLEKSTYQSERTSQIEITEPGAKYLVKFLQIAVDNVEKGFVNQQQFIDSLHDENIGDRLKNLFNQPKFQALNERNIGDRLKDIINPPKVYTEADWHNYKLENKATDFIETISEQEYSKAVDGYLKLVENIPRDERFILFSSEVNDRDVSLVGGKSASLGEMRRNVKSVQIPDFVSLSCYSYRKLIEGIRPQLEVLFSNLDPNNLSQLEEVGKAARELVLNAPIPKEISRDIEIGYGLLCLKNVSTSIANPIIEKLVKAESVDEYHRILIEANLEEKDVAVRSSASAEDLPDASFAGQQDTYLNIRGSKGIINASRKCFASIFTDRAISYRAINGYDHLKVDLAIPIQEMVRSDLGVAGVIFTVDTETGNQDNITVTVSYGLGELVVGGNIIPDEVRLHAPQLRKGYNSIMSKKIGSKFKTMVYGNPLRGEPNLVVLPTPSKEAAQLALTDKEILELGRGALEIADHFGDARDLEFAKDGKSGKLFFVQARPETVASQNKNTATLETYVIKRSIDTKPVLVGTAVGSKIASGRARYIEDPSQMSLFNDGEILVAKITDPTWEPIMKRASAIITSQGGRTCHAAIIAREMGIPAIVGTGRIDNIRDGEVYTVSCAEGQDGKIYEGEIPFYIDTIEIENLSEIQERLETKMQLIIGNPSEVDKNAQVPNQGAGLARMEFIISQGEDAEHPIKMVNEGRSDELTERVSLGVSTVAAAFYPKPVVIRMSDFKSNEYKKMVGGENEPTEENPMIGWRGASRHLDERYIAATRSELAGIQKAVYEKGMNNIVVMLPFVRTIDEAKAMKILLKEYELDKGAKLMCEIPANVTLARKFMEEFPGGFSIGSNDLTQLELGLDRDSSLVAHLFDERNEAVTKRITTLVETRNAYFKETGIYVPIGICGQGPSDHPEFAEFLYKLGIDSMALQPDSIVKTTLLLNELDQQMKSSPLTSTK